MELTRFQLVKLGGMLGIAWGLIFAGCMANMNNVSMAFQFTLIIFLITILVFLGVANYIHEQMMMKEELNEPEEE